MPVTHATHGVQPGARLRAQVTVGRADLLRRRQAGRPIPQPVPVLALIDTGAECSCIDPGLIARLSLPVSSTGLIVAPGVAAGAAALGGASPRVAYEIGLVVLHESDPKLNLVIPMIEVEALPLAAFGIDVLIGRDVLAGCVLVYDGPGGSVTLAY